MPKRKISPRKVTRRVRGKEARQAEGVVPKRKDVYSPVGDITQTRQAKDNVVDFGSD